MLFNLKTQIQPPVGIIGLGRSGLSAKKLLLQSGFDHQEIFTFDENSSVADFSDRTLAFKSTAPKTLVVSPGFPLTDHLILNWKKNGVLITSEINLACAFLTDEKIVGITGSLGKSTTVSLIGAGLKSLDPDAFVGGNLGTPFCDYALNLINNPTKKAHWIALELSSYQLENCDQLKLDFSLLTYLTPNHLERYVDLNHYYQTKWKILGITKEKLILNSHGGDLRKFAVDKDLSKILWSDRSAPDLKKFNLENAVILGKHNQDNLALAVNFILAANLSPAAITAIKKFKGLRHRLEVLGNKNNMFFINDSKATTIDSVQTAVKTCLEEKSYDRIVLLLGGKDKKLPWLELSGDLKNPNVFPLFFGESGPEIKKILNHPGEYFPTLAYLLEKLPLYLKANDIILLSPGGTSYDEFKNFEDRGVFFSNWARSKYLDI